MTAARLYAEGERFRLWHGDCRDVLAQLGVRFDAVVTDPPYAAAGGNTNGRASMADHQFWAFWFAHQWAAVADVMAEDGWGLVFSDWRMIGTLASAIAGGIDRQTSRGWEVTQALAWDREGFGLGAPYRNGYEMIAFVRGPRWKQHDDFPRSLSTVVHHPWPYGAHEHHGAEKPVGLVADLMRPHRPQAALDPFCGSGSVGVAALDVGAQYVGIEREERYCEIAARRLRAVEAQGVLALPATARAEQGRLPGVSR